MIEKFELLDLRNCISLQDCADYSKFCLVKAFYGIACFPSSLPAFNILNERTKVSIFLDTLLPRDDIGVIYDKILSIKTQYPWVDSFVLPVDISNEIYAEDVFSKILTLGNIRPAINYQLFTNLEVLKDWLGLFEEYDTKNVVVFGHLPKEYDLLDQVIITDRVLKNSHLTVSVFGKFKKKQLTEYKILDDKRVVSLGLSYKNILNLS